MYFFFFFLSVPSKIIWYPCDIFDQKDYEISHRIYCPSTFFKGWEPCCLLHYDLIPLYEEKKKWTFKLASIPQQWTVSIVQKLSWLWGRYTIWIQLHNDKYLALWHKPASIQTYWSSCIEACLRSKCLCSVIQKPLNDCWWTVFRQMHSHWQQHLKPLSLRLHNAIKTILKSWHCS